MLKQRLLLQLHCYVLFVPNKKRRQQQRLFVNPHQTHAEDEAEGESSFSSETCKQPPPLDHQEVEVFAREIKDPRDRELFRRLSCYFDGRRHLEDIMYYEDIQRPELMAFLDRYSNVLFTFEHDDTATSQLCPYSQLQ